MTGTAPAEPPDHLFTWVDVDEHLRTLVMDRQWPAWLREVSAYWDGVELTVVTGTDPGDVLAWLASVLGPRRVDTDRAAILLDPAGADRLLPVLFETVEQDDDSNARRLPEWNETLLTSDMGRPLPAPDEQRFPGGVTIGAFHSFKGGVGRTLHCVALAHLIAARSRERVLLIDADMEAPGISWMVGSQGVQAGFSFADFIALVHGSLEGDSAEAVTIARPHLVNQEMDGVFVLPSQRDPQRFGPPRIEPRHLLSRGRSPYFLTESLAELARALGARTVLVDLRAGMSETSAPVLLDPRVKRVFVTTVSRQSVHGTIGLLGELARRAPSLRDTDPVPTALITQFHEDDHTDLVESVADEIGDAIAPIASFGQAGQEPTDSSAGLSRTLLSAPLRSPFTPQLLALPAAWSDVRTVLDRAETLEVLEELADELTPAYVQGDEGRLSAQEAERLQRDRRRLAETAERMLAAAEPVRRQGDTPPMLSVAHLVTTHRRELPVETVAGSVGSGMTSAFLALCRNRSWQSAATSVGEKGAGADAPILPVLTPRGLAPEAATALEQVRAAAAPTAAAPESDLRARITDALESEHTDAEWLRIWLSVLARAAGRTAFPDMAEEVVLELAHRNRLLFALHGLADLFPAPHRDARQQQALRVLLVDCRNWLRRVRNRPLGLVVFLRRDLVRAALGRDADAFLVEHRPYALVWKREEALRLTAWVADQARAHPYPRGERIRAASTSELTEHLVRRLWAEQLGSPGSREARSQEWFLTALADFTNQIQPEDILRFLSQAARTSHAAPGEWNRLLTPDGMREALVACSHAKVESVSQAIPAVGDLLARLAGLDEDAKAVPFTLHQVGLTSEEADLLTEVGIIAQVKGEYWMPDLYRSALGFTATRRPPLLSIAKEARRRFPEL